MGCVYLSLFIPLLYSVLTPSRGKQQAPARFLDSQNDAPILRIVITYIQFL